MWEKIGNEILPNHEAEKLYAEYLKTIFPESKVQDVVWHGTPQNTNFDKFIPISKDEFGAEIKNAPVYFTNSIFYAKGFAENEKEYKKIENSIPSVVPALINIKEFTPFNKPITRKGNPSFKFATEYNKEDLEWTQYTTSPDDVHILGSKSDIEKFKEFVSKNENIGTKKLLHDKFEGDIKLNKEKFINELNKTKIGDVEINIELSQIIENLQQVEETPQVFKNTIKIHGIDYDLVARKENEDIKLYILGKDGQTFNTFRSNNEKVAGWVAQGDYSLGNEEKMYNSKDHWGVSVTPELKGSGLADFLYNLKSLVNNQLEYEHVTETNYAFLTFYIKKGYIPYSLIKLPDLNEEILGEDEIKNILNEVIEKRKTKGVIIEKDMEHAIKLKLNPTEASKFYKQIINSR